MAKAHSSLVFCLLALALVRFAQAKCTNGYTFLGIKELSEKDKQKLLDFHNKFRELTAAGEAPAPKGEDGRERRQPPAANMLELTWHKKAEKQAYKWARTCEWKHNNATDKAGNSMGQNLGRKMSTEKTDVDDTFDKWSYDLVRGWFDEAKLYKYGSGFSMSTGHYTQVVWANTSQVGCGYSYYMQIDEYNQKWYTGYLVCNYSPAGNFNNREPYEISKEKCTDPKLESSKNYKHLCVLKKKKKN
uniref:Salivary antigen-5 n=1 Tax=Triatoma infestans TaxID=30076 RepID=VA5_TRIIF|nr:antigen-5-like protein precursor [Triatoma infestans]